MKTYGRILTQLALVGALALPGMADTIDWAPLHKTLVKPDHTSDAAIHQVTSADGNEVTFKLRHLGPASWNNPGSFHLLQVGN